MSEHGDTGSDVMPTATDSDVLRLLGEGLARYVSTVARAPAPATQGTAAGGTSGPAVAVTSKPGPPLSVGATGSAGSGGRVSKGVPSARIEYARDHHEGSQGDEAVESAYLRRVCHVEPSDGDRATETVIGTDDRFRVYDSEKHPWCMVTDLEIRFGSGVEGHGTGFLVSPRLVLTAGHCVFDSRYGGWADTIGVLPGRAGPDQPHSSYRSSRIATVRDWLDREDPEFDYGVVLLDEPVGERIGWFALAVLPDTELNGRVVKVAGYPFDLHQGQFMYCAESPVARCDDHRVYYEADTYAATSGGPVWIAHEDAGGRVRHRAVAVHAGGTGRAPTAPTPVNSGTRVTPDMLANIRYWIDNGV